MSGWGCQHEVKGRCSHVNNIPCDPGMKGCVLFGRFIWADESKNRPKKTPPAPENKSGTDGTSKN
jgi:hypothetical protein